MAGDDLPSGSSGLYSFLWLLLIFNLDICVNIELQGKLHKHHKLLRSIPAYYYSKYEGEYRIPRGDPRV